MKFMFSSLNINISLFQDDSGTLLDSAGSAKHPKKQTASDFLTWF